MSSHREAPAISRDPVADNTDLYAFVSPDDPGTVTIISNYLPLEAPYGGPNFFEFGPDVRYRINIDNNGDGDADIIYEFAFETQVANPNSFLYNSGPILSIDSAELEPQAVLLGHPDQPTGGARCSARAWPVRRATSVRSRPRTTTCWPRRRFTACRGAGPCSRDSGLEGFYVDLGSIFDLGQPAAVREAACDVRPSVAGRRCRRERDRQLQRALDRAEGPEVGPDASRHDAHQRLVAGLGGRRVGVGQPAGGDGARAVVRVRARGRRVVAGVSPRQSAVQRGARRDGVQGPVELAPAVGRQAVRRRRAAPRAGDAAARAVSGRVPEPGQAHRAACRPRGDPPDRAPRGSRPGLPELHRKHPGRHAAAECGDPAVVASPTSWG